VNDPRIRYVQQPVNLGLYRNHNFCLEESRGEFLCFFHDHDEHDPQMIRRYVAFLQRHPEVGAVCSNWELIDEAGRRLGVRECRVPSVTPGLEFIERTIRSGRSSLCIPGTMVRRSALGDIRFDAEGPIGFGDFPVWLQLAEHASIGHLPERLWRCRQVPQSQSACTIETMTRDYEDALTHYCNDYLTRWPTHQGLVERWKRAIRRYVFWALAFEVGLHYRKLGNEVMAPRPNLTLFELLGYRLDPVSLQHAVDRLWIYRTGSLETVTCLTMALLIRARMAGLFTWATHHVSAFRRLLRLQ
jgi:glycosyltransferase involved in cell wall biosynthesis